ncbi:UDP-GalNAc:beta-1,3-N-acetylgalactosaminyltransferase 1-like [Haliotis rubra]|uniref:UDP-GalNAc:beta-1, 3-N-acetylgalactosaminyltransferase 1-like n=1 Tax=Haliotis rubra TaxID=36100 RepID=UPI001EE5C318|nr:UDP-GalNAc:beta-1,3-N-acetylgalactosaminyltransferase 1-like [Haliotis rubra]
MQEEVRSPFVRSAAIVSTGCENICRGKGPIDLLYIVHSAPNNFKFRTNIRKTFANQTFFPHHEIRIVFLLGKPETEVTQLHIIQEQTTYGDVVQGSFQDSYRNLTLKAVLGLKWVSENCPNVSFVVKIDDDTFVQTFSILEQYLPRYKKGKKLIFCNVWKKGYMTIRRQGKWNVADDEMKGYDTFPWKYCSGFVVMMTGDLLPLLYKASLSVPILWVDDVYITGILVSRIKHVKFVNVDLNLHSSLKAPVIQKCFSRPDCRLLFGGSKSLNLEKLWKMVLKSRNEQHRGKTQRHRLPYKRV